MALTAFATISPKADSIEEVRAAISGILEETRAEEGCFEFRVFENENRDAFHIFEVWKDQAAFDFHHAQPYTIAAMQNYDRWLAKPVAIQFLSEVSAAR